MLRSDAALVCVLAVLGSGVAEAASPPDLFKSKCTTCHSAERTLRKRKDRAGWEKTVGRMKRYASGLISDEDAEAIIDYLSRERGPAP